MDIRHPTDLSLLSIVEVFSEGAARKGTMILIGAMQPHISEIISHKHHKYCRKAKQLFLAEAKRRGLVSARSARSSSSSLAT
jgi:hypothetical protein